MFGFPPVSARTSAKPNNCTGVEARTCLRFPQNAAVARTTLGIIWTAATVLAMVALATGKARTGLNTAVGWWWADPLAGLVIVYYGLREGRQALTASR